MIQGWSGVGCGVTASRTGRRPRVRAPELRGRGWLNTGGADLPLADLRGRFVLLDFWAFCCVNCLHVLDELRPLEETYAGELVVVGVHSPKFVHEADPDALAAAVERYEVEHPVLDDPELVTWQAYTARAWPTLVLVDPEGYVVAQYAGEGHAHAIDALVAELREEHLARGTLQPGDSPYVAPAVAGRRPAVPGEGGRPSRRGLPGRGRRAPRARRARRGRGDRRTPDRVGRARAASTAPGHARFNEPNGLCLLPGDVAADGRLRRRGRRHRATTRCAASASPTGRCATARRRPAASGAGRRQRRPLEPVGRRVVAGPGVGRDGRHATSCGRSTRAPAAVEVAAGTANEGLLDGPLRRGVVRADLRASRADGDRLWLADSETSSLRYVEDGEVHTVGRHGAVRLRLPGRAGGRRRCSSTRSA